MREEVIIRKANLEDIKSIREVEEAVWPNGLRASIDQLTSRISTFPEGNFVGVINGRICGFASSMIVDIDYEKKDYSWYEITDNGYVKNNHNPNGRYLYAIDLSVTNRFGKTTENRISRGLIEAIVNLVAEKNLECILLGCRIPKFHEYADKISVEQYVFGPWDLNGKKRRNPYDPELYFYMRNGVEVLRVIPDYINDADSLNYGVLVRWNNPFYPDVSLEEAEISLSKITDLFSYIDTALDYESNCLINRWTLLLPGAGCEWYKKSGGCYMCGFNKSNEKYTHGRLLSPWFFKLMYKLGYTNAVKKSPAVLTIFNGGSFMSDKEIPREFQEYICKEVQKNPTIKKLVVESRAEFVTDSKVKEFVNLLGDKELEIAIGLECVTDSIREKSIHKGMSRRTYENAVSIAKNNGAKVSTYVFLKPIGLNEAEGIDEAIKTIKYAFGVGSDAVALESAFIQPGTRMEELYNKNEFMPPWLWSIIYVAEQTKDLGPVYIGGFTDEPRPIAIPKNCDQCSSRVYKALDLYRETFDISHLTGIEDCKCKKEWAKEVNK